ncbi:hypothetical protein GCM10023084_60950 [Streptomyces lacrimifluminis]|uniref:Uncharacterized protein n=1 Tax=Streptomyces lacrimifluminis TaxID=1500077 RepID=A0A917NVX0_9ACTN|nr:hypothetical protein GCM10012282_32320 [Streptomyces lacrimifluminis]
MQQGEFEEARHRLGVAARHTAPPYGPGIHAIPGPAQSVSTVWMLVRPVPGHRPIPLLVPALCSATMRGPDVVRNMAGAVAHPQSPYYVRLSPLLRRWPCNKLTVVARCS